MELLNPTSPLKVTVATIPLASTCLNLVINVTDLGSGVNLFVSDGTYWKPQGGQTLLLVDSGGSTLTGSTVETQVGGITIPKILVSPRNVFSVNTLWSMTSSANNKTPRIRLGGISGTIFLEPVITTSSSFQTETHIRLRNNVALQAGMAGAPSNQYGVSGVTGVSGTVDMSAADTEIAISGQLANSSEAVTLRSYFIMMRG